MRGYVLLQRLLLVMATAILINGCSHPRRWEFREVLSKQYNSRQLSYHPESSLNGIGLELLEGPFGTVGYVEVTVRTIPPIAANTNQALLILKIENEPFTYESTLMEGGQRLLLPQDAIEKIIECLRLDQPFTLYLNGYISKFNPVDYSKTVAKFISADKTSA